MSGVKEITGIILSGGKSSRMGREKGLYPLNGKPLIEYAIDLLQPLCDEIIIGANGDDYNRFGYRVIKDEYRGIGPIAGIYSCLHASRHERNFVVSCDMPFASGELVRYILGNTEGFEAVIPYNNGLPEPLCAFYRKDILPELLDAIKTGNYKLQDVIGRMKIKRLDIVPSMTLYDRTLFTNLNSMQELNSVEGTLRKGGRNSRVTDK